HLAPGGAVGEEGVLQLGLDTLRRRCAPIDIGVGVQPVVGAERAEYGPARPRPVFKRREGDALAKQLLPALRPEAEPGRGRRIGIAHRADAIVPGGKALSGGTLRSLHDDELAVAEGAEPGMEIDTRDMAARGQKVIGDDRFLGAARPGGAGAAVE